jgi:4-carboxymuconolactone decarboxylase
MARVRLIEAREQASPSQLEAFDHIAASRGSVLAPFAVMLHRPEIARAAADLGAVIRFESRLSDREREVAIATTAMERRCEFEWTAHRELALAAGVPDSTLDAIGEGSEVDAPDGDVVRFVRELCRTERVEQASFDLVVAAQGEEGAVELACIVGYYSMIATVLGACEAC